MDMTAQKTYVVSASLAFPSACMNGMSTVAAAALGTAALMTHKTGTITAIALHGPSEWASRKARIV